QEPFAPLLGALARHLYAQSPAQRRRELEGCAWLVRLLPELAEQQVVPAPSWTLPPEQERRLMFGAVARYLANAAGPAGTLLVLDDLQWAGVDALDLLTMLVMQLHTPEERPLRILGAYRSTEMSSTDPLKALVTDLAVAGLAASHPLGPLARPEARELLDAVLGEGADVDAGVQEELLTHVGGVPYFLVSCAQALRGGMPPAIPGTVIPWHVAESIRQRVAALPRDAQEILAIGAIVGRSVERQLLVEVAGTLGQSQREVIAALEILDRTRLLVEGEKRRHQFPHDLIREVVLADLSAARRALLH